jgi:DNA (cytosine-5)-methyltransferase 1
MCRTEAYAFDTPIIGPTDLRNMISMRTRRNRAVSLQELTAAAYKHVAPKDVEIHFARLNDLPQPEPLFSPPQILNRTESGIPFADLFCGAGGLSLGFEQAGAICKYALDYDASALESFAINRPENLEVVCSKIEDVLKDDSISMQVPLVIGGPPCQGFSLANQQRQTVDPRNRLYADFLELSSRFGANILVLENVPGILKQWPAIHEDLEHRGYANKIFILEASDYGVPQRRRRVFIVAAQGLGPSKTDAFFNDIESGLESQRAAWEKTCLEEALFGLPTLSAKTVSNATYLENDEFGYTINAQLHESNDYVDRINAGFPPGFTFNHRTKYNNARDIALFKCLGQGEDTKSEAFHKLNPYKNRDHIFKDKFYRLHAKKPSKTVTAHMYYDCHMYIHPTQDRGLTPRESARVQGFPDQYLFLGKPNEWYRQIGNSVSPLIARCLAKSILSAMEKHF